MKLFCLPRNWIHLLQNYFSAYVYLNDIYKKEFEKGIIKKCTHPHSDPPTQNIFPPTPTHPK